MTQISDQELEKQINEILSDVDNALTGKHPEAIMQVLIRALAVHISWSAPSRVRASMILAKVMDETGYEIDDVFDEVQTLKQEAA